MKIVLELDELEFRIVMYELWNTVQYRVSQCMFSSRMWLSNNPHHFEDKIEDMQAAFKKRTIEKIKQQLKKQGINTDYRYALIADEEIPEVKNFLITNKIEPRCSEHKDWIKGDC